MIRMSSPLSTDFCNGIVHAYVFSEGRYIAFVVGQVRGEGEVLTRIHDQCETADVLHSRRCDCREQRILALRMIANRGQGVFINTPLEGRGHGLLAKIEQYSTQSELGLDTYAAATYLGYSEDARDYNKIPLILADLGVKSIALLTSNANKARTLAQCGLVIDSVVPLDAAELSEEARRYVIRKREWQAGNH